MEGDPEPPLQEKDTLFSKGISSKGGDSGCAEISIQKKLLDYMTIINTL
jgi:hypothetical protein